MLLANYHGRYEPGPRQAKWDAFERINYACSGIIDGQNVVGYLPTPEKSALRIKQAKTEQVVHVRELGGTPTNASDSDFYLGRLWGLVVARQCSGKSGGGLLWLPQPF